MPKKHHGLLRVSRDVPDLPVQRLQAIVHIQIHLGIQSFIERCRLWRRFKNLADPSHGFHSSLEIRLQAQANGCVDGCTEARGFVGMWPFSWQPEDVCSQLHGRITLRAAPGDSQAANALAVSFFYAFFALAQSIRQAFENGTVNMRPGMDIAKANNGAFCLWPGLSHPRAPIGL